MLRAPDRVGRYRCSCSCSSVRPFRSGRHEEEDDGEVSTYHISKISSRTHYQK